MQPTEATHGDFHIAEQFDDADQQREASALGMWIFLGTEVLLFGGLFVGFTVYLTVYPQTFHAAAHHLYMSLGGINTGVLLLSSLLVALAVHSAQLGHRRGMALLLLAAIVLGLAFLGIKITEYTLEYREHLVPWLDFRFDGPNPDRAKLFFLFYFMMTGLHAFHMIIGISVLTVIAILGWRGRFSAEYHNPVEIAGLYWHFVDIVWIFLFPTLYLIRH